MFICKTNFQISNHVITKNRSYADLDYKITRFQIFTEDFKISVKICQRFQPEAYKISRSEQPLCYSRLFSHLLSPASESDEQYSRSTLFNVLEGQAERVVTSVVRFLRNSPLSSKTVHTSRLLATVLSVRTFNQFTPLAHV